MPDKLYTSAEAVERLAREITALASREAQTMPPGWAEAHDIYTDTAYTLRALHERVEESEADFRELQVCVIEETGIKTDSALDAVSRLRARAERAEAALREILELDPAELAWGTIQSKNIARAALRNEGRAEY